MFDLTGKTALITGPEGQLGPIWTRTLKDMGFDVIGIGLPDYDLSKTEHINGARIDFESKNIDVIVLNAGIDTPPGSDATFFGNADDILRVNLLGNAKIIEAFLPKMIERKRGNIVFIGSMLGFVAADYRNYTPPFDKPWAYGASKAGMWNLCKNMAVRLAPKGIICNMLALSGVRGKQYGDFIEKYSAKIPIGRMLEPDDFIPFFKVCVTATVPCDFPIFVGGGFTLW